MTSVNRSINFFVGIAFFFAPISLLFVYRFNIPLSLHIPFFVILFAILFFQNIFQTKTLSTNRSIIIFVAALFLIVPSALFSNNVGSILLSYFRVLQLIMPYFVLLMAYKNTSDAPVIAAKFFTIGNIVGVIYAFQLFFAGEVFYAGRLTFAEEYNPTSFGANAAASILFLSWLYAKNRVGLYFMIVGLPILTVGLVLSQSRNAMICLLLAGIAATILRLTTSPSMNGDQAAAERGTKSFIFYLILVVFLLTGALFAFFTFFEIDEKFYSRILAAIFFENVDEATAGRDTIWVRYLSLDYPIWGLGFNVTETLLAEVRIYQLPHNGFILSYVQGGLFFLALFIIFVMKLLSELRDWSAHNFPFAFAVGA